MLGWNGLNFTGDEIPPNRKMFPDIDSLWHVDSSRKTRDFCVHPLQIHPGEGRRARGAATVMDCAVEKHNSGPDGGNWATTDAVSTWCSIVCVTCITVPLLQTLSSRALNSQLRTKYFRRVFLQMKLLFSKDSTNVVSCPRLKYDQVKHFGGGKDFRSSARFPLSLFLWEFFASSRCRYLRGFLCLSL